MSTFGDPLANLIYFARQLIVLDPMRPPVEGRYEFHCVTCTASHEAFRKTEEPPVVCSLSGRTHRAQMAMGNPVSDRFGRPLATTSAR